MVILFMTMGNFTNQKKDRHYYSTDRLFVIVFLIGVFFSNCTKTKEKTIIIDHSKVETKQIADTIIYDVLIMNPDKDNEWTNYCLKNLNKKELVNFVFNAVYSGKATAYHYYTNEKFSIDDVKQIESEPDFSRDKIAKIQFVEEWLLDEENFRMYKTIHSIMLGYEVKDDDGITIRGYKPTFRVYLNN